MTSKGAVVLGMLALAALSGCASATRTGAGDAGLQGGGVVQESPVTGGDGIESCEQNGGWYDRAAGVCDSGGS
jgi:hypothetical protein